MNIINYRIEALAFNKRLSHRDFAKLTGSHYSAVSRWISGERTPDAESICRICRAFNVSADWLLGLDT